MEARGSKSLELRLVRRVMELSMQPTDWARKAPELVRAHEALQIFDTVAELLRAEDSLVEVPLPARVYGDIHGQLPDLLQFFNAFSWPDKPLGDFVDRGSYSVLVIMILFSIKVLYPKKVFL